MTYPFNQKFPAGYVLEVESWENDGDHTRKEMLYGLTDAHVKFYVAFLPFLESCHSDSSGMGNEDFNVHETFSNLMSLYDEHKEIIISLFPGYRLHLLHKEYLDETLDLDLPIYGQLTDRLYNFITSLVSDPVEYEGDFVRVYNGHKLYFLKEELVIPQLKEVQMP